ncbi:MAG TPA: hypothetical protein ENI73_10405 [Spirochaetes bacterium]|nr:hypothetical protein [Spirochaetota bacterium]
MRDSGQSIHCPKCEKMEMKVVKVYDIAEIDLCNQCGGLWFDQDELKELIRNEETVRTFDFARICDIEVPDTVNYKQCFCPVCEDVELRKLPLKRSVSHYIDLSVDHCPLCCGYFLDRGEYSRLASPDMLSELRRYLVLL